MPEGLPGGIMLLIYQTLLALLHFFYNLYCIFFYYCRFLKRKCSGLWYGNLTKRETEMLLKSSCDITKLPRHLVIILGYEENCIFQFIQIIAWCVTLGIPYISFYDHKGSLTKDENFIQKSLARLRPDLMDYVTWHESLESHTKNRINGTKPKIRISNISYKDSRGKILLLTENLGKAVSSGSLKLEDIDENLVNDKLCFNGVPDPDIALVCNDIFVTHGILPWHTRTTEFFMLPLHSDLSVSDFSCILRKFSHCEQRHGK